MVVINSFLSYLMVFIVLVVLAVLGAMIGVRLAKARAAKRAQEQTTADEKKGTEA